MSEWYKNSIQNVSLRLVNDAKQTLRCRDTKQALFRDCTNIFPIICFLQKRLLFRAKMLNVLKIYNSISKLPKNCMKWLTHFMLKWKIWQMGVHHATQRKYYFFYNLYARVKQRAVLESQDIHFSPQKKSGWWT